MQAGSLGIQQQVHRKSRPVFLFRAQKDAVILHHCHPPDAGGVQFSRPGAERIGLAVDEDAVADLPGEPPDGTLVQLPVRACSGRGTPEENQR